MKPVSKNLIVIAGALLFNLIFWQEKLALNAILFDLFILLSVFYLYPSTVRLSITRWLVPAHLVTLAAVIIHNTLLSKIAFSATLLLVVVFAQYLHRSPWYALASGLMNYVFAPGSLYSNARLQGVATFNFSGLRAKLRVLVIPLMVVILFFVLYNFANTVFKELTNNFGQVVSGWLKSLFGHFDGRRIGFLLWGLFITSGLLLKSRMNYFSERDNRQEDKLHRRKNDLRKWRQTSGFRLLSLLMGKLASGINALRNEYRTAIITLALLNGLLLCINCLDLIYVWFGFGYNSNINLSDYVHEGIGLLIFSILMAMALLLFFFRGNLNFYNRNRWLILGAYAWLFQNAVLVVSVFLRDYYYIAHYGLTYKRIGVLIFLVLVLAGLVTVFIKIRVHKTAYFLWKLNAWIAILVLVVCSCVHWDEMIAQYNLARRNIVVPDIAFLLTLSDKTLPILDKNKALLNWPPAASRYYSPGQLFDMRKQQFTQSQKGYSWLSWNWADYSTKKQLGIH